MGSRLILVAMIAVMSGCASYEWRNDRADAHWESDLNECRASAMSTYPKALVQEREIDRAATDRVAAQYEQQQAAARSYSSSTTCSRAGRAVQCDTWGTVPVAQPAAAPPPPVVYRTRTVDVNARDRERFTQTCIAAKGWHRVRVDD